MPAKPSTSPLDRRRFLQVGAGVLGTSLVAPSLLAACGKSGSGSSSSAASTTTTGSADLGSAVGGPKLLAAAKADGTITTAAIGTPNSYYVPVIDAFQKYAGFDVDVQKANYPPSFEVTDLAKAKQAGAKPPYDVVELTAGGAADAIQQKLLLPYNSTLWDDIPSTLKDSAGAWSSAYFGTLSFITDVTTQGSAPKSWAELADQGKPGSFAMLGDPRSGQPFTGGLSMLTVLSASLANGGSLDDVAPGIDLLAELVKSGVFDPTAKGALLAVPETVASEAHSVSALFSFDLPLAKFNGTAHKKEVAANAPSDGLLASFYAQGIAKGTPHVNAAKLWVEFLQSDQGAEAFLRNSAIPARHAALRSKKSTSEALRKLLPSEEITNAPIPTQAQIAKAQQVIDDTWASKIPTVS